MIGRKHHLWSLTTATLLSVLFGLIPLPLAGDGLVRHAAAGESTSLDGCFRTVNVNKVVVINATYARRDYGSAGAVLRAVQVNESFEVRQGVEWATADNYTWVPVVVDGQNAWIPRYRFLMDTVEAVQIPVGQADIARAHAAGLPDGASKITIDNCRLYAVGEDGAAVALWLWDEPTQPGRWANVSGLPEAIVHVQTFNRMRFMAPDMTQRPQPLPAYRVVMWQASAQQTDRAWQELWSQIFHAVKGQYTLDGRTYAQALGLPADASQHAIQQQLQQMWANHAAFPLVPVSVKDAPAPMYANPGLPVDVVLVADPTQALASTGFSVDGYTQIDGMQVPASGYGIRVAPDGHIQLFIYTAQDSDLEWSSHLLIALWGMRNTIIEGRFIDNPYPDAGAPLDDLMRIDEYLGVRKVHDEWVDLPIDVQHNDPVAGFVSDLSADTFGAGN